MRSLPLALALVTLACGRGRFTADEVGDDSASDASGEGVDESSSSSSSTSETTSSDTVPATLDDGNNWGPPISDLGGGEEAQTQREAHGLTWLVRDTNVELGLVLIGSDEFTDPYDGDTLCTTALPIACLAPLGLPNPGVATDDYHGWTGGKLALSSPVLGSELSSRAAADAICAEQHGPEYRMGDHHDGGSGWNWWAEADLAVVTPEAGRFWVAIDDQPGNCWNWSP